MKYIVLYVENSSLKKKEFINKTQCENFINNFKEDSELGNWIDYIIKGKVLKISTKVVIKE